MKASSNARTRDLSYKGLSTLNHDTQTIILFFSLSLSLSLSLLCLYNSNDAECVFHTPKGLNYFLWYRAVEIPKGLTWLSFQAQTSDRLELLFGGRTRGVLFGEYGFRIITPWQSTPEIYHTVNYLPRTTTPPPPPEDNSEPVQNCPRPAIRRSDNILKTGWTYYARNCRTTWSGRALISKNALGFYSSRARTGFHTHGRSAFKRTKNELNCLWTEWLGYKLVRTSFELVRMVWTFGTR